MTKEVLSQFDKLFEKRQGNIGGMESLYEQVYQAHRMGALTDAEAGTIVPRILEELGDLYNLATGGSDE